jgi:hypothetical protein
MRIKNPAKAFASAGFKNHLNPYKSIQVSSSQGKEA